MAKTLQNMLNSTSNAQESSTSTHYAWCVAWKTSIQFTCCFWIFFTALDTVNHIRIHTILQNYVTQIKIINIARTVPTTVPRCHVQSMLRLVLSKNEFSSLSFTIEINWMMQISRNTPRVSNYLWRYSHVLKVWISWTISAWSHKNNLTWMSQWNL